MVVMVVVDFRPLNGRHSTIYKSLLQMSHDPLPKNARRYEPDHKNHGREVQLADLLPSILRPPARHKPGGKVKDGQVHGHKNEKQRASKPAHQEWNHAYQDKQTEQQA